jgi:hypothetical protein
MAIGIGLHCWYCEKGPCNGECNKEKNEKHKNSEKFESILNILLKSHREKGLELTEEWKKHYEKLAKDISKM